MQILQVTPYFPPTWAYGGIPRIVDGLARALHEKGHSVHVLTTDAYDQESRSKQPLIRNYHGITVYSLPNLSNRLAYNQQLFLPRKWKQVQKLFPKFDIIHLHGHRHLLNNLAVGWAEKHQTPYVMTTNGTLERYEQKQILKTVWDQFISGQIPFGAASCIGVSPSDMKIHHKWGISPDKTTLIPNGLDLGEFSQLPKKGFWRKKLNVKEKLIVYLGRISPRKGVDHLIQAFQHKTRPNVTLAIAGNDMGGLQKAQKLAHSTQIHFLGTLGGEERLQLLVDADILVYASEKEIFGLVPFEGLLAGSPVIVSDDCGCGQLISEAGAGLLVRYGDIEGLSNRIDSLLYDETLARSIVIRGRKYIENQLSFSRIAERHIQLYKRICDTKK
jgi:glycosyltransferase involved in cell wall biosynthesis